MRGAGLRARVAAAAACVVAAACAGTVVAPPSGAEYEASVEVVPLHPVEPGDAAVLADLASSRPGAQFEAIGTLGGGRFRAIAPTRAEALATARAHARAYLLALDRRRERALTRLVGPGGGQVRALRLARAEPERYALVYAWPGSERADAATARGVVRAALLGAVVAAVMLLTGGARWRSRWALAAGAPLGVLAVVAAAASPPLVYAALLIAGVFAAVFVHVSRTGREGFARVIAVLIVLTPLRGALISAAGQLELTRALLVVNVLPPAIIAACACAAAVRWREITVRVSRPLAIVVGILVAVCSANILTQTVGLELYAIGLGQYLTYPVLALVAYAAVPAAYARVYVVLLILMAVVVALTVGLQASVGLEFQQAAGAFDGGVPRYGGSTGSYLHASIFLGTAVVLAAGWLMGSLGSSERLIAVVALAVIASGLTLTYGRAGFLIAALGLVVLVVCSPPTHVRGLLLIGGLAMVLVIVVGAASGLGLGQIGRHVASSFDWSGNPGNRYRLEAMEDTVRDFRRASLGQQLLGQGLAETGNARKLTDLAPRAAESYFLKLLVEVGVVGMLLVGGIVLWGGALCLRLAWRAYTDPVARAAGAAGFALTVDALAFPTLEVQLLAFTWWLLVALTVRQLDLHPPRGLRSLGLVRLRALRNLGAHG